MSPLATPVVVAGLIASLVASPVVWPSTAQACAPASEPAPTDATTTADARHAEAVEAFAAGDLPTAVAKFKAAYDADPSPAYLFNIGRVYEEMGELANALAYYEEFAGKPGLKLVERQQAAERIEVLRTLVPTTPTAAEPAPGDPPVVVQPDPDPTPEPVDPEAVARARTLRITGASLLGVGALVGLGGGIGLGLLARNRNDQVEALQQGDNPDGLTLAEVEDLDAEGRSFEVWQIVTAAGGGAIAVTGAVLLGIGFRRRPSPSVAGLRPSVRKNFAGFSISGRF